MRRKPKQRRAQATVDFLLEAAARVLVERGYAAATTNRIAEAAGVSVGTLYEYFADKYRLFDALMRREIDGIVAAASAHEPSAARTVEEDIREVLLAAMGAVRYGPDLFAVLEQVPDAALHQYRRDGRRQLIEYLAGVLAVHRDELRVADLRRAAFLIVSAAEGIGSNASNEEFDHALAQESVTMLRRYLTGAA